MGVLGFLGTTAMTNVANLGLSALQMHREDNAVQRRTKDLQAAGLNPVLAAGSAATAQAPIPARSSEGADPGTEMATARSQAAMTQSQADLMQAQAEKARAEADLTRMSARTTNARTGEVREESWQDIQLNKLQGEAAQAWWKGFNAQEEYNMVGRFDRSMRSQVAQTLKNNESEIARSELMLKRRGYEGERLELERMKIVVSMLKRDENWQAAEKLMSMLGTAVGAGARMTGAAAGWKGRR